MSGANWPPGNNASPPADAASTTATSARTAMVAVTGAPVGPCTFTVTGWKPAARAAVTVPSPPSATGTWWTGRSGRTWAIPLARAAAAATAVSEPLNLSGATTTCVHPFTVTLSLMTATADETRSLSELVHPVEARGGGDVFGGDITVIAALVERAQPGRDGQVAGAGFVAAGGIGDLDVADPSEVDVDGLVHVVAVDAEVVQVGEQGHVAGTDLVDHGDGVGRGQQRVGRGAADRFDQDRRADLGGSGRGVAGGAHGHLVLVSAGDAVAVEGVENLGAQARSEEHTSELQSQSN